MSGSESDEIDLAGPSIKVLGGIPDLVFCRLPVNEWQQLYNLTNQRLSRMDWTQRHTHLLTNPKTVVVHALPFPEGSS
jgi:hypothetical protein